MQAPCAFAVQSTTPFLAQVGPVGYPGYAQEMCLSRWLGQSACVGVFEGMHKTHDVGLWSHAVILQPGCDSRPVDEKEPLENPEVPENPILTHG